MSNKQKPYPCTCLDFFSTAENKCKGAFLGSKVLFALSLLEFHDFLLLILLLTWLLSLLLLLLLLLLLFLQVIQVKVNNNYFTLCSAINCLKSNDGYFETDAIFHRSDQCRERNPGVMWSYLEMLQIIRAAEFGTRCSFPKWTAGRPKRRLLQ